METLDYIFSRVCSPLCSIRCVETKLPLPHVISASLPFSYSDHEAVETSLIVEIHPDDQRRKPLPAKLAFETLRKVRSVLLGELFKTEAHQKGSKAFFQTPITWAPIELFELFQCSARSSGHWLG